MPFHHKKKRWLSPTDKKNVDDAIDIAAKVAPILLLAASILLL